MSESGFGFDRENRYTRDGRKGDAPCSRCGKPAHEHRKEREHDGEGRWSYNYYCK